MNQIEVNGKQYRVWSDGTIRNSKGAFVMPASKLGKAILAAQPKTYAGMTESEIADRLAAATVKHEINARLAA